MTATTHHEPLEEYAGPAELILDAGTGAEPDAGPVTTAVRVTLRGRFEPLDGSFHWYGRIAATDLADGHRNGAEVRLRTPHGEAAGRLSDLDPWNRFRITGRGRPPF